MSDLAYIKKLEDALGKDKVLLNEDLGKYTTFRIGGPADCLVRPENTSELQTALEICAKENVPFFIMGNGSNLLVSDSGYRGAVIQIYRTMNEIEVCGTKITAGAGALLSQIAARALAEGLTGLEFASGIPGTLGGACVMNAGAYGGEMKDVLRSVTAVDAEGKLREFAADELDLGYRHSTLMDGGYIVVSAVMELKNGDSEAIKAVMEDYKQRRTSKQPLDLPSAGSTFKRPEGYFAGKLIQDAGLRGYRIGDAMVSEKHCGFVVNAGNATAAEVYSLIRHIQSEVRDKFGVELQTEVRLLGDFDDPVK